MTTVDKQLDYLESVLTKLKNKTFQAKEMQKVFEVTDELLNSNLYGVGLTAKQNKRLGDWHDAFDVLSVNMQK